MDDGGHLILPMSLWPRRAKKKIPQRIYLFFELFFWQRHILIILINKKQYNPTLYINWAPPSEFVSSSIPSWQILTAHAQPFRGARDLAFCLKVPLESLLLWASSEGSGETARMRRLAWTFAARIGDKYQIRLARPNCFIISQGCFVLLHDIWQRANTETHNGYAI